MKPQELWKKIFVDLLLGLLFVSLASGTSFSLPEVENVESGQAQIQYPDAATLNINASDKAIINYKSFDIKENESVMINLPAVDNEILNRVLGDQASSILGKLTCNGIFIIVNKNGIYFGPGANVDVAGLIASTRDITNSDFLDSKHIFGKLTEEQLGSLLLNQGQINVKKGGFGVLIAGAVENQGSIICPMGTVALAAGDMVRLDIAGEGLISVAIDKATASTILDQQGKPITDQLKNSGTLQADGGTVILKAESANDIFRNAINLEGYVRANQLEEKDGAIKIVSTKNVRVNAQVSADTIEIGNPEEGVPENVVLAGGELTAQEGGVTVLAKNDLETRADITAQEGDIQLMADQDADGQGEFTQAGGTIETKGSGDIYIDGAGTMTLGTIKVERGRIRIGTQRAPESIAGEPHYIRAQDDIEIVEKTVQNNTVILGTKTEDILRYNPAGSLTLEAIQGKILDISPSSLAADTLRLIGQGFIVNSAAKTTEIYKNTGNLEILASQLQNGQITLEGDGLKISYLKANNLTLQSNGSVNASPGVIVQANQVKIIAREFGTYLNPINVQANLAYFKRTEGNIDIMESLGLGSSIMLRGPPQGGFGAIIYERTTDLVLEASKVSLVANVTQLYGNITFYNFEAVIPDQEIYFEGGKSYTFKGSLNITGAPDIGSEEYYVKLRSQTGGESWTLNVQSENYKLERVNIKDAYALNPVFIPIGVNAGNVQNILIDPVWDGGGTTNNWSEGDNWDGNAVPVSGDTVTFNATSTKNCTINNVGDWGGGNPSETLTITSGYSGIITQNVALQVAGGISQAGGTFTSNATLSAGDALAPGAGYNQSGGIFNGNSSSITFETFTQSNGTFTSTSGTLTINNTFNKTGGTFTHNSGTVKFVGNADYTVTTGGATFNNVIFTKTSADFPGPPYFDDTKTITLSGSFNVAGNLTAQNESDGFWDTTMPEYPVWINSNLSIIGTGTPTITLTGNVSIPSNAYTGATYLGNTTGANNFTVNLAGNYSIAHTYAYSYANMTFNSTSANQTITQSAGTIRNTTWTINKDTYSANLASNLTLGTSGNLTITTGTFDTKGYNLSVSGTFSNDGTLKVAGGETITLTNDTDSGTVNYYGASSYTGLKAGNNYYNLTISGGGTYTLNAALDVNNNLTISSGTLDVSTSNYGVTIGNNFANSGTFTARSGTVTFDATDSGNTITTNGSAFNHLTFNGVGGGWALQDATTVNGNLTITNGTLDLNTKTFTLGASSVFSNSGTLKLVNSETITNLTNDTDSGTIEYYGTGSYTSLKLGNTYYNLTISGAGTYTPNAALDINNNLTVSAGTLAAGSYAVNIGSNLTNSATFTTTGTVTFDATATGKTITSNGTSFNHLTFNGSGGGWTLQDALTMTGNLTITSGTLDFNGKAVSLGASSVFSNDDTLKMQGGETLTNFTNDTNSGTINYNGTGNYTGLKAGNNYYNLTFSAAGTWTLNAALDVNNNLTISSGTLAGGAYAINIGNNLANSSTFTTTGTVTFDATATGKTITSGGTTYANVIFNGSGGGWALQDALALSGNLTITNGTLDLNTKSLTLAGGSVFSNDGTLKLVSSETLTNFTNDTDSGTIEYYGTGSYTGLKAGNNYNNLTISGAGTYTLNAALDVNGNLSKTAGTLDVANGSNYAINVGGSWSNSGTFQARAGTVTFDGSSTGKTITSGGQNFYNLTINNANGGWTLQDDTTVSNNFTLTNGTLSTGSSALTINGAYSQAAGTFTGGSGTTTIVGGITLTSGTFTAPSGNWVVVNSLDLTNVTFNHNNGTIIITLRSNPSNINFTSGGNTLYNLTITKGGPDNAYTGATVTLKDSFTVSNDLNVKNEDTWGHTEDYAYSIIATGTPTITVSGDLIFPLVSTSRQNVTLGASSPNDFTVNLAGDYTMADSDAYMYANLTFNGTGDQAITHTLGNITGGSWTINKSSGTAALASDFSGTNLTMTAGTFNAGSYAMTLNSSANGFSQSGGTFTATSGTWTMIGPFNRTGGTFNHNSGTIDFSMNLGNVDRTFTVTSGTATFNNVTFSAPNISIGTWTLADSFTMAGNLTVTATAGADTYNNIQGSGSPTITVNGNLNIPSTAQAGYVNFGSSDPNNFTVNLKGDFTLADSQANSKANINFNSTSANQTVTHSSGTISGPWSVNKSSTSLLLGSNTTLSTGATLTLTTGTINLSGYNLTVTGTGSGAYTQTGGTFTGGSGNATFNNAMTVSGGTFTAPSGTLTIERTANFTGTNFSHNSGTVKFLQSQAGDSSGTITTAGATLNNVTFDMTNGSVMTWTLADSFTIAGNLTVQSSEGTDTYININGSGTPTITVTGNLNFPSVAAAGNVTLGNIAGASNFTVNLAGNFTISDSNAACHANIKFNSSSANQTITQSAGTIAAGTWTVDNSGYSANMASNLNLTTASGVKGNLTLTSGTLYTAGYNLTVDGTFSNNATLKVQGAETLTFTKDTDSGTVEYVGSGSTTYSSLNYGNTYYHLKINSTSGNNTFSPDGTLTVNGNLTLTSGTLDINGQSLALGASSVFSNDATLKLTGSETLTNFTNDTDSGTINYKGTSSYTGLKAGNNYYSLTFSGAGTYTLNAALDANNNLTVSAGTLAGGAYAINIGGSLANSATFTTTGTVTFDATATGKTITSGGTTYTNVIFNGSGGGWSLQDALDVDGNLTITNGTLNANGKNIYVAGGFSNNATFTAGSSTFIIDGTGASVISGSTTFYNFTSTSAGKQITFTATTTQIISGTTTLTGAAGNLIVLKSSSTGTQWKINPQGLKSISYVNVRDSYNLSGIVIDPANSTDSGNNFMWFTAQVTTTETEVEQGTKAADQEIIIISTVTTPEGTAVAEEISIVGGEGLVGAAQGFSSTLPPPEAIGRFNTEYYALGKYNTVVIVWEGKVNVGLYEETGLKTESIVTLTGGQSTSQTVELKPVAPEAKPVAPEAKPAEEAQPLPEEVAPAIEEKKPEEIKPVAPEAKPAEEIKPIAPEAKPAEEIKPVAPETKPVIKEVAPTIKEKKAEEIKPVTPEVKPTEEIKPLEVKPTEEVKAVAPEAKPTEEIKPIEAKPQEEMKPVIPEVKPLEEVKPVTPEVKPAPVEEVKPVIPEPIVKEEAKPAPEEVAAKKAAEELRTKKLAQEAEAKKQAEELRAKKLAEEAEARKQAEELKARILEEEAQARKEAEEFRVKKLAEEAETKKKAEEFRAKKLAEEAEARKQAEELRAKKLAEEAKVKRQAEELRAKKLAEEAEARKQAEGLRAKKLTEEAEARKQAEELRVRILEQEAKARKEAEELKTKRLAEEAKPAEEIKPVAPEAKPIEEKAIPKEEAKPAEEVKAVAPEAKPAIKEVAPTIAEEVKPVAPEVKPTEEIKPLEVKPTEEVKAVAPEAKPAIKEVAPAIEEKKPEEIKLVAPEAKPIEEKAIPKEEAKPAEEVKPVAPEAKPVEEIKPVITEAKPAIKEVAPTIAEEVKPVAPEVKPTEEIKPLEVKPTEEVKAVAPEAKPAIKEVAPAIEEKKPEEIKPVAPEAKPVKVKPTEEIKPAEVKPAEEVKAVAPEAKPAEEIKPVETKPTEPTPVAEEEVKPEEVKPVEAKPTEPEVKPVEAKPAEEVKAVAPEAKPAIKEVAPTIEEKKVEEIKVIAPEAKPVEVKPAEEVKAVAPEAKPAEEAQPLPEEVAPAIEEKKPEEIKPVETKPTEPTPVAEEEVKPIEEIKPVAPEAKPVAPAVEEKKPEEIKPIAPEAKPAIKEVAPTIAEEVKAVAPEAKPAEEAQPLPEEVAPAIEEKKPEEIKPVAEEEVKPEEVKPVEAKPTEPEAKPVEAKPTEPTPAPEEEAGFDYEQPYEEGRKLMRVYLAGKYHTTVIVFEGQVVVAPYEETGPLYSAGQTLNPGQSITQQGTIK